MNKIFRTAFLKAFPAVHNSGNPPVICVDGENFYSDDICFFNVYI